MAEYVFKDARYITSCPATSILEYERTTNMEVFNTLQCDWLGQHSIMWPDIPFPFWQFACNSLASFSPHPPSPTHHSVAAWRLNWEPGEFCAMATWHSSI